MANKFGEGRGKENLNNSSDELDKFGKAVGPPAFGQGLTDYYLRKMHLNGSFGAGGQSVLSSKHMDAIYPPRPKDKFEAAGMPEASLRHTNLGADFDGDTAVIGGFTGAVRLEQEPVDKFAATRDTSSRAERLEIKGVSVRGVERKDDKFATGRWSDDEAYAAYIRKLTGADDEEPEDKFS